MISSKMAFDSLIIEINYKNYFFYDTETRSAFGELLRTLFTGKKLNSIIYLPTKEINKNYRLPVFSLIYKTKKTRRRVQLSKLLANETVCKVDFW